VASPPFERAARQAVGKPRGALAIDLNHPLGNFLRSVLLFEDSRLTDIALPARRIARRGAITSTRGPNGAQARSALSGSTGSAFTPCLTLAPKDTVTSAFTLSALVRFSGTGPQPGSFNSIGAGLAGDDTGRMPVFVPTIAGTFRTHVPAESEFLSTSQLPPTPPPNPTLPNYNHIVMVVLENKDFSELVGNSQAPYINGTLIGGGRLLTNYFAVSHPSEPNYDALYFGSTFGVTDDNFHSQPAPDLYTVLNAAGKTFIGYDERPTATPLGKHDPWRFAPEGTSVERDFATFPAPANFNTLPSVAWVIPNQANDMHDGTIAQGDSWLNTNINAYAQWAKVNNSLLVVTTDEDSSDTTNRIMTVLYGANVVPGQDNTVYNHYSMLATTLAMVGIPQSSAPRSAATATLFNATNFSTTTPAPPPTPPPLVASSLTGWHRVTVTVSGSVATLYIDGGTTWIGTATQAFANWTLRSVFGSDVTSAIEWPWPTADVFYWTRALAANEVAAHDRRPYEVLKNLLTERWLTPTVLPPPPEDGDAWDPIFDDSFGSGIAFGVLAQTPGMGRFTANAVLAQASTPIAANTVLIGGGFFNASARVVKPATAVIGGSGGFTANGLSSAPHANFNGVGSLNANASRVLRKAFATIDGAASFTARPGVRFSVRAAQQGSGALITDPFILEPFNHGRFGGRGVGTLTAVAIKRSTAPLMAVLAGSGRLNVGAGLRVRYSGRCKIIGNGTLIAKPHVRRKVRLRPGIAAGMEPDFVALELETFVPGSVPVVATYAHGTRAHGTLSRLPPTLLENTEFVVASDLGYRTSPGDQGGVQAYPPLLSDAYQIDAALTLEPSRTAASAAWGNVVLANPNQRFDHLNSLQNSDGRSVRLLSGSKRWDPARQYFTDPTYASLSVLFSGLATPWALTDQGLSVPLRDASYWLEKPLTTNLYGGTGFADGTPDLKGKPKPMLRGGTPSAPVQNITPTLIDPNPAGYIYQYSDEPGEIRTLYEAAGSGPGGISYAGDTTNLWGGAPPIGQYRTDNSRGLFQLGSLPVGQITVDAIGYFHTAGQVSNALEICRYLLLEEMALPGSMVDGDSFTTASAAHPNYVAGMYFGTDESWTCVQAIDAILGSLGANLVPTRDGRLRLTLLRALRGDETPVASYDETDIISLTRRPLPTTLDPPPYRFRVSYLHNYTVLTAINYTLVDSDARAQYVQSADRYATWYDPTILNAYRRPNDFQPMNGPLLTEVGATEVANEHGALWGRKRRTYNITLPRREFGWEFGDVLHIKYPVEDLTNGQATQVVGYSLRATDATVTYTVLV